MEAALRCRDLEGAPRAVFEGPEAYFRKLEERGCENVFSGELYLAWHRGTYTAQAKTKLGVRRAECLLKEAEYWNTLLALRELQNGRSLEADAGAGKRAERLHILWKRLLMQEFHDILPGTGIARVHQEAEEELERAGVNVVYGFVGLKIHAKLCLVVRREAGGIKRYVHIGTGNYNASSAKIYTDLGLITADDEICADVTDLFNVMTGCGDIKNYRKLFV